VEEKWEQAKIYLETVDELDEDETDPYNAAAAPLAWGLLYYQRGDYVEAERQWTKAFELADQADNIFIALTALVNRSAALTMLQHLTDAEGAGARSAATRTGYGIA
jgi:tetratricopeptide (TPR) repeat protein